MSIFNQLLHAVLVSPWIIVKGKERFFVSLMFYIVIAIVVFGGISFLLVQYQDNIRQMVMDYLLPKSWHGISKGLMDFFFESQTKVVLAGMILSGSMVVASILLFPIKEYCSAKFEEECSYQNGPRQEFPLWLQGVEEIKLFALYVTAQSVIFAIGYYPYEWCSWVSNTLSILFLCFSFGLDFIAPTLQRHRMRYTSIIKLLTKNIFATLAFGAFFSIPLLLLGRWILKLDSMSLAELAAILFMVNIAFLALAIPAGTHLASQLMPNAKLMPEPSKLSKQVAYGFMVVLLIVGVSFHGLLAMSMHHKSQLLKCDYDIDFGSMDLDMPSLMALARGEKDAVLSFNLTIHNPTAFDLDLETSHLSIFQNGQLISRTLIAPVYVGSGDTREQPMMFKVHLNTTLVSGFPDLLKGWTAQVEFELLPGIPFIVKVL